MVDCKIFPYDFFPFLANLRAVGKQLVNLFDYNGQVFSLKYFIYWTNRRIVIGRHLIIIDSLLSNFFLLNKPLQVHTCVLVEDCFVEGMELKQKKLIKKKQIFWLYWNTILEKWKWKKIVHRLVYYEIYYVWFFEAGLSGWTNNFTYRHKTLSIMVKLHDLFLQLIFLLRFNHYKCAPKMRHGSLACYSVLLISLSSKSIDIVVRNQKAMINFSVIISTDLSSIFTFK